MAMLDVLLDSYFVNQLTNLIDTGRFSIVTILICLAGIFLMMAALVGIKWKDDA